MIVHPIIISIDFIKFQAGGCCHTFIDKGYEFDVGIHYIGEMSKDRINRTLVDQITDGQLEWEKLDEEFDVVSIGLKKNCLICYFFNRFYCKKLDVTSI